KLSAGTMRPELPSRLYSTRRTPWLSKRRVCRRPARLVGRCRACSDAAGAWQARPGGGALGADAVRLAGRPRAGADAGPVRVRVPTGEARRCLGPVAGVHPLRPGDRRAEVRRVPDEGGAALAPLLQRRALQRRPLARPARRVLRRAAAALGG